MSSNLSGDSNDSNAGGVETGDTVSEFEIAGSLTRVFFQHVKRDFFPREMTGTFYKRKTKSGFVAKSARPPIFRKRISETEPALREA